MDGIEVFFPVVTEPTVCAPVKYVQTLTTSQNALFMGEMGVVVGILTCALCYVGYFYAAPWFVKKMGWI